MIAKNANTTQTLTKTQKLLYLYKHTVPRTKEMCKKTLLDKRSYVSRVSRSSNTVFEGWG